MKVIVFGASGRTGRHACVMGLEHGHDVTAFGRSAAKLKTIDERLAVAEGDVFDPVIVAAAIAGHDAVLVCLGSQNLRDKTTLTSGTKNVVDGMESHGVGRLLVVSAAGVNESWAQIPWLSRILFKTMLRNVFADHHGQEAIVLASSVDWTIVRAGILTDDTAPSAYRASNTEPIGRIGRAAVAGFLVQQLSDQTYVRKAISITS